MKAHDDILNTLEGLKDTSLLKVPEGYFDAFPHRIHSRIQAEAASSRKKLIQIAKPWMGLAASFLLVAAIYLSFGPFAAKSDSNDLLASNSAVEFDIFLSQFSEYELVNYIAEQDLDVSLEASLSEIDFAGLSEEDLHELILF